MRNNMNPQTSHLRLGSRRRGMALLFVVSLILFITLLGTSFVVVSQQFSKTSILRSRIDSRGDSTRPTMNRLFNDLVRGPDPANLQSPFRGGGSLLADMYGYGFSATVDVVAEANYMAPQDPGEYDLPGAIEFTLSQASVVNLRPVTPGETPPVAQTLSPIPGAYNGRVLTFVSGALTGTTVRIVGYSGSENGFYTGAPNAFIAYPEQSRDTPATTADIAGTEIVLNGRAYFGWGAGGPGVGGALGEAALAPNRTLPATLGLAAYNSTGPNESYDAPDYQNMFLAALDPSAPSGVIPSFERDGLAAVGGSFRAFGAVGSGLQVDNDGDGVNDSIWIDPGYAIQTDIDGRRYKTLVAYMVLDMDGRFNINAHGDIYDFDFDGDGNLDRGLTASGTSLLLGNVDPLFPVFTSSNPPLALPHGQYLGPPEVSMRSIFASNPVAASGLPGDIDYQQVLFSRYGETNPDSSLSTWGALPGNDNIRDEWQKFVQFGHPDVAHADESYPNAWVGGLFGTAQDVHGRFARGISNQFFGTVPVGLPTTGLEASGFGSLADEIRNSPYEMSLLPTSRFANNVADLTDDWLFTPKEVERMLRPFDRDVNMLPSRLTDLVGNRNIRTLIGPASFETPAIPPLERIVALDGAGATGVSLNDRVVRLLNAQMTAPFSAMDVTIQLETLLSFESRMGLPFDLNRPFGDGRDNDGDGIYDEPDELANLNETLTRVDGSTVSMATDEFSRYNFARQLYTLLLLVTGDTDVIVPNTIVGAGGLTDADTIRRLTLAQWAINIVDFRDSDSIHTPFEFDFNPFNGWQPDGDLTTTDTDGFVVWGLERPELLLTENVAFHDRRAQDLTAAGGGDVSGGDDDFDSRLVPNASVFFELYRPWSQDSNDQLHPRELGATDTEQGIDLRQVTPGAGHPVWRMVVAAENFPVSGAAGGNLSTRHRDVGGNQGNTEAMPEVEQRRRIYFVEPDTVVEPSNRHKVYWPDATVQSQLAGRTFVGPGEYAVIGSAGTATGAVYDTWFGRRSEPDWDARLPETRGISLLPSARQVEVRQGSPDATAVLRDAVAIPINMTVSRTTGVNINRSLGISDPLDGYFDYETLSNATAVGDGFAFSSIRDIPVDNDDTIWPEVTDRAVRNSTGMTLDFRSVFLQRLADPTQNFDPLTNPYLTIDAQYVDLTTFNGAENDSAESYTTDAPIQAFAAVERGRVNNPTLSTIADSNIRNRRRLWPIEHAEGLSDQPALADTHLFDQAFIGSIGTVNVAYEQVDFQGSVAPVGFAGLTWNNRPFASRMELLDVPFTNSTELLASPNGLSGIGPTISSPGGYTLDRIGPTGNPSTPMIGGADNPYPVRGGQFGHLLNFFSDGTIDTTAGSLGTEPDNLLAFLDFVRVPSRFAGTRIHIDSQTLAPPFNTISRYREPGKINLNTMMSAAVRQGLLGSIGRPFTVEGQNFDGSIAAFSNEGVSQTDFEDSRRGATIEFDNPFRGVSSWEKVPVSIALAGATPVNASAFRLNAAGEPIFDTGPAGASNPLPWADPNRESASQFETFRRIGGTTTTRSSVFGIWITAGRFEVDQNGDLLPGVGEGVELGGLEGRSERNRAFYMIDRSIPVAFEPGKDHNIENMILIESIID